MPTESPQLIRFGLFEVDLRARELRRSGIKLKLHEQVFQLLCALIERPGEVLTREELRQRLWPGDTFVDFDQGINTAIKKLRETLGDSAEHPRFVETLARRGYRFLAPVENLTEAPVAGTYSQKVSPVQLIPASVDAIREPQRTGIRWVPWTTAIVLFLTIAWLGIIHMHQASPTAPVVRLQMVMPENVTFEITDFPSVAPDGQRVVYAGVGPDGKRYLWVRSLDALTPRQLAGTEGAVFPFWSPDSRFIGFYAADIRAGTVKIVGAEGSQVVTVSERVHGFAGGTWSRTGTILFSEADGGLFRVSATGGEARPVLQPKNKSQERYQRFPEFLPDGRHFIYVSGGTRVLEGTIRLASLDSAGSTVLLPGESNVSYTSQGLLIYGRQETLFARPLNMRTLQLTGEAIPIAEGVARAPSQAWFLFSASGNVLAYRSQISSLVQVASYNRNGERLGITGDPAAYDIIELSPDETRLALERRDNQSGKSDIWLLGLATGISTRLTFGSFNECPVWSGDGNAVLYVSDQNGQLGLYRKVVGSEDEELLLPGGQCTAPQQCLRDGSVIFLGGKGAPALLPPGREGKKPVLLSDLASISHHVSPDGHWVAYHAIESGRFEVYIATFPSFRHRRQISNNGGCQAWWRKDGKELFYLSLDGKLMSVELKPGTQLAATPRKLFQTKLAADPYTGQYVVSGDGKQFFLLEPVESSKPFTVVLNWTSGLKR